MCVWAFTDTHWESVRCVCCCWCVTQRHTRLNLCFLQLSIIRRVKGENVFVRHSKLMLEVGKEWMCFNSILHSCCCCVHVCDWSQQHWCVCVRESVCVCVCECECECACACACACASASVSACVRVFVTNQDIDLYNDTGMTQVLQGEGDFSGHWPMSPLFKTLINNTEWGFFGGKLKCTVSCEG